jgi:hypothetical protein
MSERIPAPQLTGALLEEIGRPASRAYLRT